MKQKFKCLVNNKNLYQLKVENITVKFKYSKNNKKIYGCMLNILRDKIEK